MVRIMGCLPVGDAAGGRTTVARYRPGGAESAGAGNWSMRTTRHQRELQPNTNTETLQARADSANNTWNADIRTCWTHLPSSPPESASESAPAARSSASCWSNVWTVPDRRMSHSRISPVASPPTSWCSFTPHHAMLSTGPLYPAQVNSRTSQGTRCSSIQAVDRCAAGLQLRTCYTAHSYQLIRSHNLRISFSEIRCANMCCVDVEPYNVSFDKHNAIHSRCWGPAIE